MEFKVFEYLDHHSLVTATATERQIFEQGKHSTFSSSTHTQTYYAQTVWLASGVCVCLCADYCHVGK